MRLRLVSPERRRGARSETLNVSGRLRSEYWSWHPFSLQTASLCSWLYSFHKDVERWLSEQRSILVLYGRPIWPTTHLAKLQVWGLIIDRLNSCTGFFFHTGHKLNTVKVYVDLPALCLVIFSPFVLPRISSPAGGAEIRKKPYLVE